MEDKFRELGFATKCIHVGNAIDRETGALRRPITMANSYELSADRYPLDWGDSDSLVYARNGSSNQHYLQECLADIDMHMKFARELEIVTFTVLLGHDESLIVYTGPDDSRIRYYPENFRKGFFRLSVGLEDVEDLIHDIGRSLRKCSLSG